MTAQQGTDSALGKRVYAVPARLAAPCAVGLELELKVQLKGKHQ